MNEFMEMYMNRWTPPVKKERLWLLADNHRQFEYYSRLLKEHALQVHDIDLECKFIYDSHSIRGSRNGNYLRVGTWYEKGSRQLDEIFEILHILDFKEIEHPLIEKEKDERLRYYADHDDFLYDEGIRPIKNFKDIAIWGQEPVVHHEEFLSEEEMTI
jgi:hypothetical protein